jgi:hypothetical protein
MKHSMLERADISSRLETQRSVREILSATISLYRRYPLLFVVLALAVVAPYDLAVLGATGYGPLTRLAHKSEGLFWLNVVLRTALVNALISALHVHAVIAAGNARRPQLKAVALRGLKVLPGVGAAALLAGIGIAVAAFALLIPGVVLALRWAVVPQAAAVEGEGPLAALSSSRQLTIGCYRHILGLFVILAALDIGVTEAARAIPLGSTAGIASVATGIAIETLLSSFSALTLALLYFDLQARPQLPARERQHYQPLET